MKTTIITGIAAAAILFTGCGKKNGSSDVSTPPPMVQTDAALSSLPVLEPALTAYLQGDKSKAVSVFLAVDWSASPLFASGSPLSLGEDQFKALSEADYHAKSKEATTQLACLKDVASAVAEAGLAAAQKGDAIQARKCFMSLKQFGTALDSTNYMLIVQLVGRGYEKISDSGMAKIGK
jgi:hypothetical protein